MTIGYPGTTGKIAVNGMPISGLGNSDAIRRDGAGSVMLDGNGAGTGAVALSTNGGAVTAGSLNANCATLTRPDNTTLTLAMKRTGDANSRFQMVAMASWSGVLVAPASTPFFAEKAFKKEKFGLIVWFGAVPRQWMLWYEGGWKFMNDVLHLGTIGPMSNYLPPTDAIKVDVNGTEHQRPHFRKVRGPSANIARRHTLA